MMKRYKYYEPGFQNVAEEYVYTEDEIIAEFWEAWCVRMEQKFGPGHPLTTRENCISDWVAVNWAVEMKSPSDV